MSKDAPLSSGDDREGKHRAGADSRSSAHGSGAHGHGAHRAEGSEQAPGSDPTVFTYVDAEGVEITAYEWAAASPHAIVQIAHGVGEHALRYVEFAAVLRDNGFTVYADDHRGHGETGRRQHGGDLSRLGKLGPGGLVATERAILDLTGIARERHPGLPVIMFGHSWGSLMTQRIINREPRPFDAAVLSGSAYRTVRHLESGALNKRWHGPEANGFEWLSRDPETAEKFIADPLCFAADILKLFGLRDAMRLYGTPAAGIADVPMLIISGGDDSVSRGDGLRRLAEAYRQRGLHDVTLQVFAGARHELLNETNRDEAIAAIVTWMLDRFPADELA